jgi:hypothetical protein
VTVRRSLAVPPYIRSVLLVSLYPLTCETNIDDEDFAGQTGRDIAPHPGARSYCQSTVKINHIARSTAFSGVPIGKKTEASRLLWESLSVGDTPMSDEQEIGGEDYREIAERVRQLARQARIAEVQQELFDLADRLERMAEANGTKLEGKQ